MSQARLAITLSELAFSLVIMNMSAQYLNFFMILSLALTHLLAYKMKFLKGAERSAWLSIAGGITVAHVFLQIYPEFKIGEHKITAEWLNDLKQPVFFFLMVGTCLFYAIERKVAAQKEESDQTTLSVFWVHILMFSVYNLLLGYVLSYETGVLSLKTQALYLLAYVLHFTVNDFGLQMKHPEKYIHKGRWPLAAGILLGWVLAKFVTISEQYIIIITALLAGAITFNMIKEELPSKRKSKFWAFLLGVLIFTLLIILI